MPKIKAELQCMQELGVTSSKREATDWCAGIVAVPKPNSQV